MRTRQVDHTTLERLDQALVDERPHVLHFIGHGDFQGEDGAIMLEAEGAPGDVDPVTGRRLATLLRNHLGSLRLVFLNSCQGSTVSRRDPFGGVAQNLIRRGVPAVIAMQFPIPDTVAIALARHFYRYLASGLPVDAALTAARAFLYAKGHAVEWGAPALHMRTPDGRLFDFSGAGPRPPAPVPPLAEERPAPTMKSAEPFPPPAGAIPEPSPTVMPKLEQSATPRAEAAPRRGSRVGVVALLVAAAVGLGIFGLYLFRAEVVAPETTAGVEPELPADSPPAAANGAPPPMAEPEAPPSASPPETEELLAAYRAATERLSAGETESALERLEAHGQLTPEMAEMLPPEMRMRLVDALQDAAVAAAVDLDQPRFERIADALLAAEPDPAVRQDMAEELARMYGMLSEPATAAPEPPAPAPAPSEPASAKPAPAAPAQPAAPAEPPVPVEPLTPIQPSPPAVPAVPAIPRPEPAPAPVVEPEPIPRNGAAAPFAEALYIVQRGDTLRAIAARHYGDPLLWPLIHQANRAIVPNPHYIRPGQQLVLPPRPPEGAEPGGLYRVARGDSLWRIAAGIYGDPLVWPQIHAANAATIPDPNRIHPGQILLLPR